VGVKPELKTGLKTLMRRILEIREKLKRHDGIWKQKNIEQDKK